MPFCPQYPYREELKGPVGRVCLACREPRVRLPAPHRLGMAAHTYAPRIREVEAGVRSIVAPFWAIESSRLAWAI